MTTWTIGDHFEEDYGEIRRWNLFRYFVLIRFVITVLPVSARQHLL